MNLSQPSNVESSHPVTDGAPDTNAESTRKIGFWLFLLILLLPVIGAWFTLRKGYSKTARSMAFAWMLIYVFASAKDSKHSDKTSNESGRQEAEQTVQTPSAPDAEATCKDKNFSAGSLFDQPGGLSIDNTSQRWKNYSDLLMNGQGSIRGYAMNEGYCFVHLDVYGMVNGNSVSGRIYALMH